MARPFSRAIGAKAPKLEPKTGRGQLDSDELTFVDCFKKPAAPCGLSRARDGAHGTVDGATLRQMGVRWVKPRFEWPSLLVF